jgi:hypothetical protein
MTEFFESYPVVAAIVVAAVSWLAISSELFMLDEKVLAICTTVMGTLGVFATFGGAQKAGSMSIVGVAITFAAFLIATAWVWAKWSDSQKK